MKERERKPENYGRMSLMNTILIVLIIKENIENKLNMSEQGFKIIATNREMNRMQRNLTRRQSKKNWFPKDINHQTK